MIEIATSPTTTTLVIAGDLDLAERDQFPEIAARVVGLRRQLLVIDMCPQANLSELLLGGLTNHGSGNLLARQGELPRATIGGYFQERLPSPPWRRSLVHVVTQNQSSALWAADLKISLKTGDTALNKKD